VIAVRRYAALGDSFTAGHPSDPSPSWADHAARMLRAWNLELAYRNLAVAGATAEEAAPQVDDAIAMQADLVTLVCGANDVIESLRPDVGACAEVLTGMVDRLQEALPGATLVTATYPDVALHAELGPRTSARIRGGIESVNAAIRALAMSRELVLLELAAHPGARARENYARDGYHPSAIGSRRAGAALVRALIQRARTRQRLDMEEAS
jgi:lysophospholipase L1-like esterase